MILALRMSSKCLLTTAWSCCCFVTRDILNRIDKLVKSFSLLFSTNYLTLPNRRSKSWRMKSIVFYAAKPNTSFPGPYWPVYPEGSDKPQFVRAEIVEANGLHALDTASPRDEETVLNSMELP